MKILQIRLKNINSLKGEHTIDFRHKPLSEAGLFAITGATGSGKTTILDVITLALFSRIPRVSELVTKGFIEKTGLVLTRNMDEAIAEITYLCNEGEFTSQWSISKNRNRNLRDYEMQISDASGNIFPLKKSDIPAKNESLIGLNFDQFSKAIILAQGDFANFLKAKKDERGKLLEKITGTWIYRELGKLAFQKSKEFGQQLESLQVQINSKKEQLLPKDDYQLLLTDIGNVDKQIIICQEQIEQLKNQEKLKAEIVSLSESIKDTEKELIGASNKLSAFKERNGERMEKHKRLLPYRKKLWEWKELQKRLTEQETELIDIKNSVLACDEEDGKLKEEVKVLTRSDAPLEDAIKLFENSVLSLQRELGTVETQLQNASRAVKQGATEISLTLDMSNPDIARLQLDSENKKNDDELRELSEKLPQAFLDEPSKKLEELRSVSDVLQSLLKEITILNEKQCQIAEHQKEVLELQEEIDDIPSKLAEATTSQKQSDLELIALQKDKTIRDLTASLEEHRKKLVDGEPCPLCGATDHPFSHEIPPIDDELERKIWAVSAVNEQWKKEISTLTSTLSLKQKSLEKTLKEKAEKDAESSQMEERVKELKASVPAEFHSEDTEGDLNQIKENINHLEKYRVQEERVRKLQTLSQNVDEWQQYFHGESNLSNELKSIFTGKDVLSVTQNIKERFTKNNTRNQELIKDQAILKKKNSETRGYSQTLTEELAVDLPEYDTLATPLMQLMEDGEYTRLQTNHQQLLQDISNMETRVNLHNENLKKHKEKDNDTPLDEVQRLKQEKEAENKEYISHRDELKGKQVVHEKTKKELDVLATQIATQKQQNEKWVLLSRYIGDAEGRKFSTFAQELTLLQLVKKANKRLSQLNDRYMLGLPSDEEDDSLVVIDTHMGDMRRSVKSLSGGETFLVSLSLALALSDLAAHKVEIKSLFIDEGFGSLDKLTLDQTMDTLEKLQYETSKTIGVISHVEAMQERITSQIRVEKGGQGHSSIEVMQIQN